jgi:hypothetical protein
MNPVAPVTQTFIVKAYQNQRFLLQSPQILHRIPHLSRVEHSSHGRHSADRPKSLRHLRVWIDQAVEQSLAVKPVRNTRKARGRVTASAFHHVATEICRGETFVTRKITRAVGRIKLGMQKVLYLGNIDALHDWGFAGIYVDAMYRMVQQEQGDDYVVSTGKVISVREFCELSFGNLGMNYKDFIEIGLEPARQ